MPFPFHFVTVFVPEAKSYFLLGGKLSVIKVRLIGVKFQSLYRRQNFNE